MDSLTLNSQPTALNSVCTYYMDFLHKTHQSLSKPKNTWQYLSPMFGGHFKQWNHTHTHIPTHTQSQQQADREKDTCLQPKSWNKKAGLPCADSAENVPSGNPNLPLAHASPRVSTKAHRVLLWRTTNKFLRSRKLISTESASNENRLYCKKKKKMLSIF